MCSCNNYGSGCGCNNYGSGYGYNGGYNTFASYSSYAPAVGYVAPAVGYAAPTCGGGFSGGLGAGVIGIAVLILIALGVIF